MEVRILGTDGRTVCRRCLPADSRRARLRGLLGRRELEAGEGLLLRPCASVHTCFLPFPIDVVFLDDELRVLRVVDRLGPWRLVARRGARAVLELGAGEARRRAILSGERLSVVGRPVPGGARSDLPGAHRQSGDVVVSRRIDRDVDPVY